MNLKPVLSNRERFPLIEDLSFLKELQQATDAPLYNFQSGDRLDQDSLERVRKYKQKLTSPFWKRGELPHWMNSYLQWCKETVPAYKEYSTEFHNLPTIQRNDIAQRPWNFVSDECDVNELLVYSTSGTTGQPMDVMFNAQAQASWIPQLESILSTFGITLKRGSETVAIALICAQDETLTYASLSTYLDGAGVLKINLNPKEWKSPAHRVSYLERCNPEVLTGDPFAFMALAALKPNITPKVMVSSAMSLSQAVRSRLETEFNTLVIDLYSLTECRMIAYRTDAQFTLIRPDLFIEILAADRDVAVENGKVGEITVTGGNNPFLPLVRYRTGDFAILDFSKDGVPFLSKVEGRAPVPFFNEQGKFVNSVDISRAMTHFMLVEFTLHQNRDLSLTFNGWAESVKASDIKQELHTIFGNSVKIDIRIEKIGIQSSKKVVFTSDYSEGESPQ